MLDAIVQETGPNPNHAVIWMGWNLDGSFCSGGAHAQQLRSALSFLMRLFNPSQ